MKKIALLIIIPLCLIACDSSIDSRISPITSNEFKQMVIKNHVKSVVFVFEKNGYLIRVSLTEEAYQLDEYQRGMKTHLIFSTFSTPQEGPHFKFIPFSLDRFYDDFKKYANKDNKLEYKVIIE